VPGVDVYEGCRPSYTGKTVTKDAFLAVLTGDSAAAKGPVLKSTAEDKVFINFADHGGVGLIEMPDGMLHSKELMGALKTMHTKNMYKKLVFYMEACESGSMFQNLLPTNMSIYATTAANAKESSWGTYCPPHDIVDGKQMQSCLGDLYSVNWMEDSDKASEQSSETLEAQYKLVKQETNKSHSMEFGDLTISQEHIHDYQGAEAFVRPITIQKQADPAETAADRALREVSMSLSATSLW